MDALLAFALLGIALAERSVRLRFERSRFLRRYFASDLFYLASGAVGLGFALRQAAEGLAERFAGAAPALAALPAPVSVLLATLLYDLGAYLTHFLLHRVDLLWRFHKVHHSSPNLDWLATFRAHVVEHALRHLASPVALLLLGFPVAIVAVATAIHTAWSVLAHANLGAGFGFLEPLLVTPRLHRLHHVPATSGQNLGVLLTLWDRLRGTFVADPGAALHPLGVPGEVATYPQTWLPQLVEPLRRPPPPRAAVSIRPADGTIWGA